MALLTRVALIAALAVCLSPPATAQPTRAPQIGQPAPGFSLPDVNGKTVALEDYRGKKNVMLVFSRGWIGYW
jgi:cytochrome oxidase Cu insertion factor (SCO1/SenC/PrrC family)